MPTISAAIAKLRHILTENAGKDNVYGKAAEGKFPLVVHVQNEVSLTLQWPAKADFVSTI